MSSNDDLPALLGGPAIRPAGPPVWPPCDRAISDALNQAFEDGSWGRYDGGRVRLLEERLAARFSGFVAVCGSGTYAVELALRALKVGPGDEVAMAAYDYPGNFLSVHAVGATPVLVDLDPDNRNISPAHLRDAIGPKMKAVLVSHLHGGLVPMREIREIVDRHGIPVIEDAAQSVGAVVDGKPAGTWGDIGILSFGGSKQLTAGRGGALLTCHADLFQRARLHLTRHGNVVSPLSELQATVLLPQWERLDDHNRRRSRAVERLLAQIQDIPGLRPFRNRADGSSAFYKVGFVLEEAEIGLSRARFVAAVRAEGIALDEGFRSLHVGRSATRFRAAGSLEVADLSHRDIVALHHPVLLGEDQEIDQVALAFRKTWRHASKLVPRRD